ncbi:hypothetical protein [Nitratidesulfovibrio liaohensis]|uniref:hypothetical protein n=1 Tax=Nitratidesulfovibrio liaohensis TaxID=2604158 RepID=UPI00141F3F55|nr:hypothetical protein [Nitratidesulfovibrio liaohensis]NHZ46699.1 hypothetical protein [Nitratidesulfovibrio liaohensis]
MKNVKNIIKLAAVLAAFYAVVQIVNPTGEADSNAKANKYTVEFAKAERACQSLVGGKVDQIMKYGK